jgi:hypothetical protein
VFLSHQDILLSTEVSCLRGEVQPRRNAGWPSWTAGCAGS